jgi:hypothetical protein
LKAAGWSAPEEWIAMQAVKRRENLRTEESTRLASASGRKSGK